MTLLDGLLPEFDREMGFLTRRVLERVPNGNFAWQPHPKSMTLGRLAEHLAELPQWVGVTVAQSEFDMGTARRPEGYIAPQTRNAVLALFDASVTAARTALAGKTDAELMAPWTLFKGGQVDVHDAEGRRAPLLRDEPHRAPPRADDGVSPIAGCAAALHLRPKRRRGDVGRVCNGSAT